jgi:hypothetical protein
MMRSCVAVAFALLALDAAAAQVGPSALPALPDSLERSSVQACHRARTWSLTGLRVGAA